ncbi:hypothetical protein ES703_41437 [subsurface metagenome]
MRIKAFILMVAVMFFPGVDGMAGDFTDNGDGTVTDNVTCLMWQQGEAGSMNWEDAITYCKALYLAGYTDWRLPNIKEMESITDDTLYGPAIDTTYFPDVHGWYYSSTSGLGIYSPAWCVSFVTGHVSSHGKSNRFYVRCVRGGQ